MRLHTYISLLLLVFGAYSIKISGTLLCKQYDIVASLENDTSGEDTDEKSDNEKIIDEDSIDTFQRSYISFSYQYLSSKIHWYSAILLAYQATVLDTTSPPPEA
jgi:hypothetical protein